MAKKKPVKTTKTKVAKAVKTAKAKPTVKEKAAPLLPSPLAMAETIGLDNDGRLRFEVRPKTEMQADIPSWKETPLGGDPEFPEMVARAAMLARFESAIKAEREELAETLDALMEVVEIEDFACAGYRVHKYIHKSSSITRERLLNAGVELKKIEAATLTTEKTKCRISPLKEVGAGVVKRG